MLLVAVLTTVFSLQDGRVGRSIDDLGHDSPAARDDALLRLKAAGRDAWPELEAASLRHPDLEVRSRCLELLAASKLRRRIPWRVLDEAPGAVSTLRGGTSADRIALARVLARSYEETSDLLLDLVQDPDPEVIIAAAEYLQERRNSDWAPRLLKFYALEDCPRSGRAYELLTMASGRIAGEDLVGLFAGAGPRGRVRIVQLVLNASLPLPLSAEILRDWLDAGSSAERRLAMSWLRDRGCPDALRFLEPLLASSEPAIVTEALSTMRACGWRPQADSVELLLSHEEPVVREEAIQAAFVFELRGCIGTLKQLMQDPVMSVRQSAIATYARLSGPQAGDDLWAVFLRDSGESREAAREILRNLPQSMERLKPLLQDADPELRIRGYELWSRIDSVRVLAPLAKDRETVVRQWALQQLMRWPDAPGAVEALERFADDPVDSIRFDALRALVRKERRDHAPALEAFLGSREYSVRFDAAETLLALRDDRARELAHRLVSEPDSPMRRLGYFALADGGDRELADRAIRELADPDSRLESAAAKYLRQMLAAKRDEAVVARLAAGLATLNGEPLDYAFSLVMDYAGAEAAGAVRALLLSGRAPRPDRAVRALSEWSGDQAPVVLAALLGRDPALNDTVFSRLPEACKRYPGCGRVELAAAFSRLFIDADRRVRRSAAQASADLDLPLNGLIALIEDREPSVRSAAMSAARTLNFSAAAPGIPSKLDDDDPDVRVAAALALASLRPSMRARIDRQVAGEDCAWVKRRLESTLPSR
ncbi:MAG TPA: HEAT repeat domain-containing protein [Planctomycetota bacterium]|nr:HEAT repeat domain-containing protein [Planctomycetota bacterium]